MKPIAEDAIAKISWGILAVIGAGLVSGTAYVVSLANAVEVIKQKQVTIETMATDIAVIKTKVESIEKKLGE